MRLSDCLTVISAIITFLLVLFVLVRVIGTECFSWFDYFIMFGTLLGNLGINILAALGR